MKKNNLKVVKIDKNKSLFNYEKKILINELILDLKLGYYDFEKEKAQKVKFSLEIDYNEGELQIEVDARDDKPVISSRKRGSMIFFPSYLRHRITPVTSGHRYFLVSWLT